MEVEKENLEFEALLRDLNSYISVAKYFNFDAGIPATESTITEHEIAWQKKHTQKDCINAIVNEDNVCEEAKKILDDDGEEDGIQEEKLTFAEYLAMLDKINKCYPPRMRRRSNVLFRSHIGWEIADHAENIHIPCWRHHNVRTGIWMKWTYLRRLCDVSLVGRSNRPIWHDLTTYQLISKWDWPT